MKGLLIKDWKLIKAQRNVLLLIMAVAVFMTVRSDNQIFGIGYLTFIGALFTLSTISYDEADNGNAFLFAMPVSRKGYVTEKYVFGLLLGGSAWLFGTLLTIAVVMIRDAALLPDMMRMALLLWPLLFGLLAVMFPFQLKFGGEKGRIMIVAVIGLICLAAFAVEKAAEMFHIDLAGLQKYLPDMGRDMMTALAVGAGLVVLYVSYRISVSIMNKKEF